jgi:hypothetical protein
MFEKIVNALTFSDDGSKRDFKGWAVAINGTEA